MPTPLKVLIVEDNLLDAELLVQELRGAGFEPEWQRVDTEAEYLKRLQDGPDLVLSDFQMPLFSGLQALELLKASGRDIPFILVSGTIGEDIAVAAMKTGASDYLLKDRLARLGPAIRRAFEQNQLQRENRRTDQALRDNAVFIHEVLNSLSSAVAVLDESGNITSTNETWRRFGRENGGREFLNENYLLVCANSVQRSGSTDAQTAHDGIRRVLDGTASQFSMEYPCHSPTEQRWFLMHVSPLGGARRGVVIAHENITERKRAEETLRESEERFSGAFEHAPIGMALVAPSGRWLKVNRTLCDLVGYAEAELLTQTFQDITHPEDIAADLEYIRQMIAGEINSYQMEKRYVHAHGHVVVVLLNVSLVRGSQGHPRYFISQIQDITVRRRTENALRESEEKFRRLIENASDVIAVVNSAGVIQFQSPSTQRVLGYEPEEVLGHDVMDFIHPEDRAKATQGIQRAVKGEPAVAPVEYRMRHRDGTWRIFQSIGGRVPDAAGQRLVVVNSRDVTEMRKLEEQFLRAQRLEAIGTLSSGIAHDLNNILAPMLIVAPMLKEKISDPQDIELLTMIEQAAQRGADIIKQLLTFSRGIEGERNLMQTRHLLKEMVTIIRETFPREITTAEKIPANTWPILADATQIHQVLMNLCVNARDAMPGGGRITLAEENLTLGANETNLNPLAIAGSYVRLTIADTGEGIPPENLARIFEPFFTTKEVGKGTGLGLSTVVGIVKSHGGFITVNSEPGAGTSFRIFLPAVVDKSAAVTSTPASSGRGSQEMILIVDDETPIRHALSLALERNNYRVLAAASGQAGVSQFLLHRASVRLVLTDIMMPGMNGVALIRTLRALEPRLRIIALSGLHDQARRDELTKIGVTRILAKPCSSGDILQAVQRELAVEVSAN